MAILSISYCGDISLDITQALLQIWNDLIDETFALWITPEQEEDKENMKSKK
jgi:hypothetical protein